MWPKQSQKKKKKTNTTSKWIKNLNVRLNTPKLLEENIGRTLFDINITSILGNLSLKAKEIKAKINTWDSIKLKSFCIAKEAIHKTKRQPIEWKKIIANDMTHKELIPTYMNSSYNSKF